VGGALLPAAASKSRESTSPESPGASTGCANRGRLGSSSHTPPPLPRLVPLVVLSLRLSRWLPSGRAVVLPRSASGSSELPHAQLDLLGRRPLLRLLTFSDFPVVSLTFITTGGADDSLAQGGNLYLECNVGGAGRVNLVNNFPPGHRASDIAEALRGGVEKTLLMLLSQGLLHLPKGADLVAFVKAGGKVEQPPPPVVERLTFKKLADGTAGGCAAAGNERLRRTAGPNRIHFVASDTCTPLRRKRQQPGTSEVAGLAQRAALAEFRTVSGRAFGSGSTCPICSGNSAGKRLGPPRRWEPQSAQPPGPTSRWRC
jgi:hypothetical protein